MISCVRIGKNPPTQEGHYEINIPYPGGLYAVIVRYFTGGCRCRHLTRINRGRTNNEIHAVTGSDRLIQQRDLLAGQRWRGAQAAQDVAVGPAQ